MAASLVAAASDGTNTVFMGCRTDATAEPAANTVALKGKTVSVEAGRAIFEGGCLANSRARNRCFANWNSDIPMGGEWIA
jgi:hypothetical protein